MSEYEEWRGEQSDPVTEADVMRIVHRVAYRVSREQILAFVQYLEAHPEVPHEVPFSVALRDWAKS